MWNSNTLACVPTTNEMYDLTMVNEECKEMLSEGLKVKDANINIETPYEDSLLIAILISDDEIVDKLGKCSQYSYTS